jgi:hypothetical protein
MVPTTGGIAVLRDELGCRAIAISSEQAWPQPEHKK